MFIANQKTTILPFNLAVDDYTLISESHHSGEVIAMIYLMYEPSLYYRLKLLNKLNDHIGQHISTLQKLTKRFDDTNWPLAGRVMVETCALPCNPHLWEMRFPEQVRWTHKQVYTQVGFAVADKSPHSMVNEPIANSMFLYDMLVCRHRSTNPGDHDPLEGHTRVINDISVSMSNVFENGYAVYPNEIHHFRDKLAVMARAMIAGKDPFEEYELFLRDDVDCFLGVRNLGYSDPRDIFVTTKKAYGWDNNEDAGSKGEGDQIEA